MLHFPKSELVWGAHSLAETFGSILKRSFHSMPFNLPDLDSFIRSMWLALAATAIAWFLYVLVRRDRNLPLFRFALGLVAVFVVTVMIHWIGFRLFGLLLPVGRTGIYFYPLGMLAVGALAAIPSHETERQRQERDPPLGHYLRASLVAVLCTFAACFLLCLRLTYFEEWAWNADAKKVYSILNQMARDYGTQNVSVTWCYVGPLHFYQLRSEHSFLSQIVDNRMSSGESEVVVTNPERELVPNILNGLEVIYRGPPLPLDTGNTLIAVKPELADVMRRGGGLF